jgi:hypothetical protein
MTIWFLFELLFRHDKTTFSEYGTDLQIYFTNCVTVETQNNSKIAGSLI